MAVCEIGSQISPDIESAVTLILDVLASRNERNKYLLFQPPRLWYFCYHSPKRPRYLPCAFAEPPVCVAQQKCYSLKKSVIPLRTPWLLICIGLTLLIQS